MLTDATNCSQDERKNISAFYNIQPRISITAANIAFVIINAGILKLNNRFCQQLHQAPENLRSHNTLTTAKMNTYH
jgi:hypothetical protein